MALPGPRSYVAKHRKASARQAAIKAEGDLYALGSKTVREIADDLTAARKATIAALAQLPAGYRADQAKAVIDEIDRALRLWEQAATSRMGPSLDAAYANGSLAVPAALAAGGIDIGVAPSVSTAYVAAAYQTSALLIKDVSTDVVRDVDRAIRRGALAQATPFDLIRDLGTTTPGGARGPFRNAANRAEAIVRTEMGRVASVAADASMRELAKTQPGMGKEWLAITDGRVRDAHARANGQVQAIGTPFDVGGEQLQYPRDPRGSAGNTIQCRCVSAPTHPDWDDPTLAEPDPVIDPTAPAPMSSLAPSVALPGNLRGRTATGQGNPNLGPQKGQASGPDLAAAIRAGMARSKIARLQSAGLPVPADLVAKAAGPASTAPAGLPALPAGANFKQRRAHDAATRNLANGLPLTPSQLQQLAGAGIAVPAGLGAAPVAPGAPTPAPAAPKAPRAPKGPILPDGAPAFAQPLGTGTPRVQGIPDALVAKITRLRATEAAAAERARIAAEKAAERERIRLEKERIARDKAEAAARALAIKFPARNPAPASSSTTAATGDPVALAREQLAARKYGVPAHYGSTGPRARKGDEFLTDLAARRGMGGLPQVLDRSQIDAYVRQGEIELFRGVNNGTHHDNWRGAEVKHMLGVYGNGTYAAGYLHKTEGAAGRSRSLSAAQGYAPTIMRMTIKADAKLIAHDDLQAEMRTSERDMRNEARQAAFAEQGPIADEARAALPDLFTLPGGGRMPTRDVVDRLSVGFYSWTDEQKAAVAPFRARVADSIKSRQEADLAITEIHRNAGRFAVAKGYDVIDVGGSYAKGTAAGFGRNGYFVVLNRTAVRVQRENVNDSSGQLGEITNGLPF